MKKKKAKKQTVTSNNDRPVIYDSVKVNLCRGDKSLTADKAKDLLGWEEEDEDIKFGNDYLLRDHNGNKIRCTNNSINRPFDTQLCKMWESEILLGNWKLNGKTIVIGKTGVIVDGQHRLIGLSLASQEYARDSDRWGYWEEEPTIECLIALGIEEDDNTINTIDTGKPRSLADVIYRSPYFADLDNSNRNKVARICDYAIRLVWYRSGEGENAFSPRRTHAKSVDFLDRHPTILKAVRHIHDLNNRESTVKNDKKKKSQISHFVPLGCAAGLLYIMGCCETETELYGGDNPRNEDQLNWEKWDNACDFWVLLNGGSVELLPLRYALGAIVDDDNGGASIAEKCGLVIKAWNLFSTQDELTEAKLALEYHTDGEGIKTLIEYPTVGGIDKDREDEQPTIDPDENEIKEQAKEIRVSRITTKKKKAVKKKTVADKPSAKKKKKKETRSPFSIPVGSDVWVNDPDGEYDGELLQILGKTCRVEAASGAIYEPLVEWVQFEKYNEKS